MLLPILGLIAEAGTAVEELIDVPMRHPGDDRPRGLAGRFLEVAALRQLPTDGSSTVLRPFVRPILMESETPARDEWHCRL